VTRRLAIGLVSAALWTGGCGTAMRPLRFEAPAAQWERLAGHWQGEYTIADHDRRGLIEFRLRAASREAFGDVLMIPDRFSWPTRGLPDRTRPYPPPETEPRLLMIRFAAADGRGIHGAMEPYWDPDRQCQTSATFTGSIDGNVMAGRFESVCEDGVRVLRGRWRVERAPQ
jgi:hypothetical protein